MNAITVKMVQEYKELPIAIPEYIEAIRQLGIAEYEAKQCQMVREYQAKVEMDIEAEADLAQAKALKATLAAVKAAQKAQAKKAQALVDAKAAREIAYANYARRIYRVTMVACAVALVALRLVTYYGIIR